MFLGPSFLKGLFMGRQVCKYIYIILALPRCIRVLLLLAMCGHFAENVGWMLNQRCLLQFSHADKCGLKVYVWQMGPKE